MSEFAVIKTGGKQYLTTVGEVLSIERIPGVKGDKISFDQVLLVTDGENVTLGKPVVEGKKVEAVIEEVGKLDTVTGMKFKNKTRYTRHLGHRQQFTAVKIISIK